MAEQTKQKQMIHFYQGELYSPASCPLKVAPFIDAAIRRLKNLSVLELFIEATQSEINQNNIGGVLYHYGVTYEKMYYYLENHPMEPIGLLAGFKDGEQPYNDIDFILQQSYKMASWFHRDDIPSPYVLYWLLRTEPVIAMLRSMDMDPFAIQELEMNTVSWIGSSSNRSHW